MNNFKSFPKNMPFWQKIQDEYNSHKQGDVPYAEGMAPEQAAPMATIPQDYMDQAIEESNNQPVVPDVEDLSGPIPAGVVESGQVSQQAFDQMRGNSPSVQPQIDVQQPAMSSQEQLLAEFKRMREADQKALDEARSSDRMLKMGGAIGDALATVINARSQMNVKAPGVQVQQGAGLGKVADMFATAPDLASDAKARREDLLAQYKLLLGGEMTPYQRIALALADKRLKLQEKQEEGKGIRHGESVELRKEALYRPSDKQVEAIDSYDQTLASLFRTRDLSTGVETGPIADFRNMAASKLGIDDPDVTALRSQTIDTLAERIKALSGTAASEAEAARLRITLPTLRDSHEVFIKKLEEAEKRVKEAREIRLKSLAKQGKNVEAFNEISKPMSQENSKQVVKKQYSPSRNQTKIIYSDGSEEVLDGKQ